MSCIYPLCPHGGEDCLHPEAEEGPFYCAGCQDYVDGAPACFADDYDADDYGNSVVVSVAWCDDCHESFRCDCGDDDDGKEKTVDASTPGLLQAG